MHLMFESPHMWRVKYLSGSGILYSSPLIYFVLTRNKRYMRLLDETGLHYSIEAGMEADKPSSPLLF